MEETTVEPFRIIGISVRTSNDSNTDIMNLWGKFFSEEIFSKIPAKSGDEVYSVYTDYESDHTGKYTTIIGCKVNSLDNIPDGMTGKEFSGGKYIKFTEKGKMPDIIFNRWMDIWNREKELGRKYTADYEVYGEKSQDKSNAEVEIFLSVK